MLILPNGEDLGGKILRGGAAIPNPDKTGLTFHPDTNFTRGQFWSDEFHKFELIWQRNQITLKVDNEIYATGGGLQDSVNQPV